MVTGLWTGCCCWCRKKYVFSVRVVHCEEPFSFPVAASVFAPEEVSVIEACKDAVAVYSPAAFAMVICACEVAVSDEAPHDMFAIMSIQQEPDSLS